jgi:glycerophosphoryl diester phosphodiesterase
MGTLVSFLSGCLSTGLEKRSRPIKIHGHRGARAKFPENTLPAMEYAMSLGVDFLETDMGVTKDGVVVLNHDTSINPDLCQYKNSSPLTSPILIRELSLKEIKEFDCGSKRNKKFKDQKLIVGTEIPTLEELFIMVKNSKLPNSQSIEFNLETKIEKDKDETVDPEVFVRLVLEVIKKHKMLDRVILQSFDFRTLKIARRLEPKIRISALTENHEDYLAIAKELSANVISPQWSEISAEEIKALHEIGVEVAPWTLNGPWSWSKMLGADADAIITDDPAALQDYIKKHSKN